MDECVERLVCELLARRDTLDNSRRLLVGLAGIPGSGKSTLALRIVQAIEQQRSGCCICVGMDGWHYPRAVLDTFEDPAEAHHRRGAAFTFDANGFVAFAKRLRNDQNTTIKAPSFSHELKDPVPDDITILPTHSIVLVEGLYCCLDVAPWREAAACWDLRYILQVPRNVARSRVILRHVLAGICANEESATHQADTNDVLNGDWILEHLYQPSTPITIT